MKLPTVSIEHNGETYYSDDYGWENNDYVAVTKCGKLLRFVDAAFIKSEIKVESDSCTFEIVIPEDDYDDALQCPKCRTFCVYSKEGYNSCNKCDYCWS